MNRRRIFLVFFNHEPSSFYYNEEKASEEVNRIRILGQAAWYISIQQAKDDLQTE